MDERRLIRMSKLLSKVLRHDPSIADVEPDGRGWVDVNALLDGLGWDRDLLEEVTRPRPGRKDRFELSADGRRIRARYGHSIPVELGYEDVEPPEVLYHGTADRNVDAILREGVSSMRRQLVHLSEDVDSARQVGGRHGRPVILEIDAAGMAEDGIGFHRLPGGIWLAPEVPPRHIRGRVGG